MERAILTAFLTLTMLGCRPVSDEFDFSGNIDHWVSIEYDFATGEDVNHKHYRNGKKKFTRAPYEGHSSLRLEGLPDLYKKYGLSHPKPLLVLIWARGLDKNGKELDHVHGPGVVDEYFFRMLKECKDLPPEEVKAIFAHSVALHKAEKDEEITAYQRKEYIRYSAPRLREQVNAFLKTPVWPSHRFWGLDGWYTEAAEYYFIEYRDEFPEVLPRPFYQYVLDYKGSAHALRGGLSGFFHAEYRKYPTAMNAFLVAYLNTHEQAQDWLIKGDYYMFVFGNSSLEGFFKGYHAAGVLDTFLQTVMPEGLFPITRDDLPKRHPSPFSKFSADDLWNRFSDVPYGNALLLWIVHSKMLKTHFREQFEASYQERISKEGETK